MRHRMRRLAEVVAVTLLAAGASACASCAGSGGSGPLEPLVLGTEQHATIDWRAEPRGDGAVVWGYVENRSPYTFDRVRLLVEALEPTGEIVTQKVVWAPGVLGGWGRSYFEAPMVAAPTYRVRVFAWERIETDGLRRRRW
jgi:hypothetical protein